MIVEQILGNITDLAEGELDGLHVERVTLPGADLVKRIQRVRTDHDREIGLRLTAAPGPDGDLRDGDLLYRDDRGVIVIAVLPTDVLVIAPRTIEEMGRTAHALGNRHLQAQFFGAESEYAAEVMVVQYDHTVEDYLRHAGVPFERADRVLPTPFRHAEHTH
ncbi:urease accessory protein UreE [Gordonia neofelifaecis]|uniref:Urease accessory protein UreE n=1 Tax=Gordonia neofelifaecis NRRL B-59395 TaxID=644548 RepID=F1YNE0_9ACTN|nr:urease accessory protein UreE [Gordonia neofelifaecis]EGD53851.1 urease accessory protein UreE [Gordonia neofelifaecis NRRL B-59395]